jgi:hypothetical protein
MIRPFTCVCLVLAAGSGLYLYQVKQRAFALDAELRGTFRGIDEARDHTRMLRADWALMNDPERLQALASQYLTLQPMAPSQLMTMDQLASALPPPIPAGTKPAATPDVKAPPATDPIQGMPMAQAAPMVLPHTHPTAPQVALLQPAVPAPQVAAPAPVVAPPVVAAPSPPPVAVAPLPAPALPSFAAAAAPVPSFAPALSPVAPLAMMSLPPPKPIQSAKPVHRSARHAVPAAQTQPWLADANGNPVEKPRHPHHHAAPEAPPAQFYAANEPSRLPDPTPRITPPAATVMYSPSSGSSLGMAASAALAPPRPLYSTAQ